MTAGSMETRNTWAETLKRLRESGELVLLGVLGNLPVTFTHESITITAPNKGVYDMLFKNQKTLGDVQIKLKSAEHRNLTVEQKLQHLLGDKLKIEV